MKKFKYKLIEKTNLTMGEYLDILNSEGQEGWEVYKEITNTWDEGNAQILLFFKKTY